MLSFVNFARITSICVGFDLGTLHGYFFQQDFWPNFIFPLEYQIKLVLMLQTILKNKFVSWVSLFFIVVFQFQTKHMSLH